MIRYFLGLIGVSALIIAGTALALWLTAVQVKAGECGWITWYAATGNRTACGDRYTGREMIAAHRTLPCGHPLTVTDRKTGKTVKVKVRDRGPAKWTGNSLDLSYEAARQMNMVRRGKIYGCW